MCAPSGQTAKLIFSLYTRTYCTVVNKRATESVARFTTALFDKSQQQRYAYLVTSCHHRLEKETSCDILFENITCDTKALLLP